MSIISESLLFEEQTGIPLPEEFIELYQEKGNGGFGPDYGFLGIASGHKTDLGDSILELYKSFRSSSEDDPKWYWPESYIPFIHIGCAIHYCIDVASNDYAVIEFDPTDYDLEVGPKPHFKILSSSFKEWVKENA